MIEYCNINNAPIKVEKGKSKAYNYFGEMFLEGGAAL